jgi:AraC-like DNA-binding protein
MQQVLADYNIFSSSHQKSWKVEPDFHTHKQYEIFIFYNGECNYAVGHNMYQLQPGDILVMDGSLMHRPFLFSDKSHYERSIVQFSSEWIYPVLEVLGIEEVLEIFKKDSHSFLRSKVLEKPTNCATEDLEENIIEIARLIETSNENTIDIEVQLKIALVQLLLKIKQSFEKVNQQLYKKIENKYEFVQDAIIYIQNNYQKSFTLESLAENLCISKSYLVHLFKELTGGTIMDYTMNYRLKQAMHLLTAYPEMKIKEVCFNSGFKDESHFSRYFKENNGITPSQFRKHHSRYYLSSKSNSSRIGKS